MILYEWVIEAVDEHGDIQDVDHADTFAEALRAAATMKHAHGMEVEIALVRERWDGPKDSENLENRQWAYLGQGDVLPAKFDGGAAVPPRFRTEVERA